MTEDKNRQTEESQESQEAQGFQVTPEAQDSQEAQAVEVFAHACEERSRTYAMLARLYRREVDQELLDELKQTLFPARTGCEEADRGYYAIARYLSNTWENTLNELASDYVRTFVGHGNDAMSAAYPFESVYTSEKHLMMQDSRDEVRAVYLSCGLDKSDSWREGEDHIALELEFMATLASRTAGALRAGNAETAANLLETQQAFLSDHLAPWVPAMCQAMLHFSKTDFYQGLAALTEGFLHTDDQALSEMLAD